MIHTCHLSDRSLFSLSGADSLDFLHNLITCDVTRLSDGDATFGALLTPQGKVMFDFHILRRANDFVFDVSQDIREALMKRLNFYKLRAAVALEPIDDLHVFASWGQVDGSDGRRPEMGLRLYGQNISTNSEMADYQRHRIIVGIPQSGVDFELGNVFPHDVLMDQFEGGGVDFSKGCYVGQEVVSRMKHRDSARNRFVKVSADTLAARGVSLLADERNVGVMGESVGGNGLALVRIDKVGKALAEEKLIEADGQVVTLELPTFATFDWIKS